MGLGAVLGVGSVLAYQWLRGPPLNPPALPAALDRGEWRAGGPHCSAHVAPPCARHACVCLEQQASVCVHAAPAEAARQLHLLAAEVADLRRDVRRVADLQSSVTEGQLSDSAPAMDEQVTHVMKSLDELAKLVDELVAP